MKKFLYFSLLFLTLLGMIIWSIPIGVFAPKHNNQNINEETNISISSSSIKLNNFKNMEPKILMLIAFQNFRDEEYFIPKEIFEKNGYLVETVSSKTGIALGADGGEAIVTKTPNDINVKDYQALVVCGGPGMIKEIDNPDFQKLVKEFNQNNKLIGAICAGPALLAKAGLLNGIKATVWSSSLDKSLIKILKDNGALYENKSVVQDGKIITANGPTAAEDFGKTIINQLGM